MVGNLIQQLKNKKIVAAIKEPKSIEIAIKNRENISAVILMVGNILNVNSYVKLFQDKGIFVILHVEKIGGLQLDQYGIEFISNFVKPDAIVTTKSNLIKKAKQKNMIVIQRVFLIDSEVFHQLEKTINDSLADIIEIMPCKVSGYIQQLSRITKKPIITGGLLNHPEDAAEAFKNGAMAVTTSNASMWKGLLNKEYTDR